MKYITIIICIIATISLLSISFLLPERAPEENDVVMTVNKQKLTSNMIENFARHKSSHHADRHDLLNSVAIERVLVQEAQRQNIDKEPAFREAIKSFYEQSMIKILLDRQHQIVDDKVTKEEIDSFIGYCGKTITFTTTEGQGNVIATEIDWSGSRKSTELFDDLSTTIQPVLAGLQPGNIRAVFDTGNAWFAIRVEEVAGTSRKNCSVSRDIIRKIIADHKRQQQFNSWINSLIANADISIKEDK